MWWESHFEIGDKSLRNRDGSPISQSDLEVGHELLLETDDSELDDLELGFQVVHDGAIDLLDPAVLVGDPEPEWLDMGIVIHHDFPGELDFEHLFLRDFRELEGYCAVLHKHLANRLLTP